MNGPVRSCVGCGGRAPQRELTRFVAREGRLVPDGGRRAPGRGAYLHHDGACWQAFIRRRGTVRSLRAAPSPEERARLVAALAGSAGSAVAR